MKLYVALTVNSSSQAVPVYHRLGFGETETKQFSDGMRYKDPHKMLTAGGNDYGHSDHWADEQETLNVKMRCLQQRAVFHTIVVTTDRRRLSLMLSENIKAMRKSKGLSQEELAVKLNVVRQTVSKWENGVSLS